VNTNSHSSEIKRWFWNDTLKKERKKEKEKAANTNSNLKKMLKEGKKNHFSVHKNEKINVLLSLPFHLPMFYTQ